MNKEKNPTFEDFVNFMNKTSEEKKQQINIGLYNEISLQIDNIIDSQQNKNWTLFIQSFENLDKAAENSSINDVVEILLYERMYGTSSKEYCEYFTDVVIEKFCGKAQKEDFQLIQNIILLKDSNRSEQALVIYIKLGKEHGEHQLKMLNFIEKNYSSFSKNQKVLCCMLFDELLSHSPHAARIKKLINIKDYTLTYGSEEEIENSDTVTSLEKKWWQFWK